MGHVHLVLTLQETRKEHQQQQTTNNKQQTTNNNPRPKLMKNGHFLSTA
jgi:hypothetical protein